MSALSPEILALLNDPSIVAELAKLASATPKAQVTPNQASKPKIDKSHAPYIMVHSVVCGICLETRSSSRIMIYDPKFRTYRFALMSELEGYEPSKLRKETRIDSSLGCDMCSKNLLAKDIISLIEIISLLSNSDGRDYLESSAPLRAKRYANLANMETQWGPM